MYRKFGKRIIDLAISVPALILLSPVLALIALNVRLRLGSPVLFRQVRPGLYGKLYTMFKFRTMLDLRDEDGNLLPDEQRITSFGRFLRRASLDELMELWNVIRGEMSLAGPRPLLTRYMDRYSPEQARRHHVRPGITGWSQVNGRNAATWEERFNMDVWYVDHMSLGLDLRIIGRTFSKVMSREGVLDGGSCAEEFWGNQGPPAGAFAAYPAERDERSFA